MPIFTFLGLGVATTGALIGTMLVVGNYVRGAYASLTVGQILFEGGLPLLAFSVALGILAEISLSIRKQT